MPVVTFLTWCWKFAPYWVLFSIWGWRVLPFNLQINMEMVLLIDSYVVNLQMYKLLLVTAKPWNATGSLHLWWWILQIWHCIFALHWSMRRWWFYKCGFRMIYSAVPCCISFHYPVIVLDLCTTINSFAGKYCWRLHTTRFILTNNYSSILGYSLIFHIIGCAPDYQHFDQLRHCIWWCFCFLYVLLSDDWIYNFRYT